jgi:cell division protease FtsH
VINEGAILAARANQKQITMKNLENAIEKVRLGPERQSRIINEHERQVVAYHEAGHALVGYLIPDSNPLHKVTIVSRGGAGGYALFLPEDDQTFYQEKALKAQLAMALGGRTAEEIIFTDVTTGAVQDLQSVTRIARTMVTQFGMSQKLGPLTFGDKEELIFLGRQLSEQRNYSEEIAEQIDFEVRRLVDEAHERARQILTDNIDKLHLIAQHLMEEETIDAKEFKALIEGDSEASTSEDSSGKSEGPQKGASSSEDEENPPSNVVPPSTAPLPA